MLSFFLAPSFCVSALPRGAHRRISKDSFLLNPRDHSKRCVPSLDSNQRLPNSGLKQTWPSLRSGPRSLACYVGRATCWIGLSTWMR